MLVFSFSSPKFANYPVPMHFKDFGFKYDCLDIVEELIKHTILQELIIKNNNCFFFRTRNIFQSEKCVLLSSIYTSETGLATSIPEFLNYLTSLGNPSETRVLMISGSHGNKHDRVSGFSHEELLDYSLYEETCELVGVEPQRKRDNTIPEPIPQEKWCDDDDDRALLNKTLYEDMNFLVLNIKHFNLERKEGL